MQINGHTGLLYNAFRLQRKNINSFYWVGGWSVLKDRNEPLLRTNIFESLPRRISHGSCTFMSPSMSPLLSLTVSSPDTEMELDQKNYQNIKTYF